MKGKIIGIVVLIFCFTQMCLSQSETIQVEYTKTAKLTINELSLNTKTKVAELTKILGETSKQPIIQMVRQAIFTKIKALFSSPKVVWLKCLESTSIGMAMKNFHRSLLPDR